MPVPVDLVPDFTGQVGTRVGVLDGPVRLHEAGMVGERKVAADDGVTRQNRSESLESTASPLLYGV